MKNKYKGFISIFVLIILLILSITITFIYEQNKSISQYNKDLYNKKKAQYLSESMMNIFLDENMDWISELIIKDYIDNKNKVRESKHLYNKNNYKNNYVYYKDSKATIWISYSNKNFTGPKDLNDSYLIFTKDGVKVGDSQAESQVYIKVMDEGFDDKPLDKSNLKIIIKQTY